MRALVVHRHGSIDAVQLEEFPEPQPAPDQVLIDVHAASVKFPDLLVIGGSYQHLPPTPFVPGKDLAGVGRCGRGSEPGQAGRSCDGADRARRVCAARLQQSSLPPDAARDEFAEAAAMGLVYLTAHFALVERAQVKRGETVLVTGAAGGVGLAAVQIAKTLGATVVATVSSEDKAALVGANGADHVVYTNVPDLRDSLREQVFAAVGRRGADVIIDSVGGDLFDASVRAIAWCGRLVVVGFAAGRVRKIKAGYVLVKNISIIGLQSSDYRDREPGKVQRVQQELFELYVQGKLRPHIMARHPLASYREALVAVRDRRVLGKIVIEMPNASATPR
jgi:NADPH2:quinone reductase